jgi:flagellar export protein FliJ
VKDLGSVIRLHRWQLDEKRRSLADLEALQTRLANEQARLEQTLAREKTKAEASPDPVPGLGAYIRSMIDRRLHIEESRRQVEVRIAAAEEEIAEAFRELKKFELVEEDRQRRVALKRRRLETRVFDEIGATAYHRRRLAAQRREEDVSG